MAVSNEQRMGEMQWWLNIKMSEILIVRGLNISFSCRLRKNEERERLEHSLQIKFNKRTIKYKNVREMMMNEYGNIKWTTHGWMASKPRMSTQLQFWSCFQRFIGIQPHLSGNNN